MIRAISFILILSSTSISGHTQVYKCQTANGIEFSDAPCPSGKGGAISVRPNVIDRSEGRNQNNQLVEQSYAREYREMQEYQASIERNESPPQGLSRQEAEQLYKEATTRKSGEGGRQYKARSQATMDFLESSGGRPNLSRSERQKIFEDSTKKRSGESGAEYRIRMEASSRYLGAPRKKDSESDEVKIIHPEPPQPPASITSCDKGGCWDSSGGRYNKGGGNTFFGPTGACQKVGTQMICP